MNIRIRTLELVSRYVGEITTGTKLVNFLKGIGVPPQLIQYPDTKWKVLFSVLKHYSTDDPKDFQFLSKVLVELVHPLNFLNGNQVESKKMIEMFNSWLKFDNLKITDSGRDLFLQKLYEENNAEDDSIAMNYAYSRTLEKIKGKEIEGLVLLKKSYQLLINVVEIFTDTGSKPDERLNEMYLNLVRVVKNASERVKISIEKDRESWCPPDWVIPTAPHIPFKNLYSATSDMIMSSPSYEISLMNKYLGDVIELTLNCKTSDVLSDVTDQEFINNVYSYLSRVKGNSEKLSIEPYSDAKWNEKFKWDDNSFIFGDYGKISFTSNDRIKLFHALTDRKGGWVSIPELEKSCNKDDKYVRSTLGQIRDSMSGDVRKHVSIVSRQDDNLTPKPASGAYRLKYKE